MIKVIAIIGFIIFGVIVDCGGVPSDNRGYIGARFWHQPGAFRNGFKGFCSVFVNAAFAYAGTELVGLAAAEAADPRKSLPKASKQGTLTNSPMAVGILTLFSFLAHRRFLLPLPLHSRPGRPLRLRGPPRCFE